MSSTPVSIDRSESHFARLHDRIAPAFLAALLGLSIVYATGFAETVQLHNAAHDGRHSAGFPCH